jgi:hypothetical protein
MAGYEPVLHPPNCNFIVSVLIGWRRDTVRPAGPDSTHIDKKIDVLPGLKGRKMPIRGDQTK